MERLVLGVIGGGVLGILATIGALSKGESWSESLQAIPAGMALGVVVAIWAWWKAGDGEIDQSDQKVGKLQRQLRSAIESATYNEAHGDWGRAAHFRARAAEIESQLRRFGA